MHLEHIVVKRIDEWQLKEPFLSPTMGTIVLDNMAIYIDEIKSWTDMAE